MEIAGSPKKDKKYVCDLCDYKCSKESDYKKHLMTAKHIKNQNGNNMEMIIEEKVAVEFKCHICNKIYNTNSGLWKHLKNCMNTAQCAHTVHCTVVTLKRILKFNKIILGPSVYYCT